MQEWTLAQTMLRLGELVKAELEDGLAITGEVIALTPSAARIKLPNGKLALLPASPSPTDGIFRLANS